MGLLATLTRRSRHRAPSGSGALVPVPVPTVTAPPREARPAAETPPIIALPPPRRPRHDLRHISPRRFAEITHELYVEGSLPWAEYQMVGFPSELHPEYDITIGALTGQKAEPNRPRDLLTEWEQRLDFMRRYRDPSLKVAERALAVLRRQSTVPA